MLTEVASDHLLEPTLEELSEMTQATICQVVFGFYSGILRHTSRRAICHLPGSHFGVAIDELICYSNSLHCIHLIKGPTMNYHVYVMLIQDIKKLLSQSNTTL
jgi:hypothetical protein